MPVQAIGGEHARTAFDASFPQVAEVQPGSVVRFDVDDSVLARIAAGETLEAIGHENVNTVTGPVAISGAEYGDAVRIDVLDVQISRAWAIWIPGFGPLGGHTQTMQARQVQVEGARVRISETLTVPLEPMIGCIGLAPVEGRGSTMRPTYPFGGNMDLRELGPGATVWLPVQAPGGLLSLGDLHAAMGHGEPAHISIEAGGSATVRISLEKNRSLAYPRLRVGPETICVGMSDLPRPAGGVASAYQSAVDQAFQLLNDEFHLDPFEAYAYVCARVSTRFGGPAGSLVLAVVPDPDIQKEGENR